MIGMMRDSLCNTVMRNEISPSMLEQFRESTLTYPNEDFPGKKPPLGVPEAIPVFPQVCRSCMYARGKDGLINQIDEVLLAEK
jgi:hypothetical protein